MKMVYETPKMKAELFQANAYCNVCHTKKVVGMVDINLGDNGMSLYSGDNLIVKLTGLLKFKADSAVYSLNQNRDVEQWYFKAEGNPNVYLEWSGHQQQYVLYYEAGATSGFYDATTSGGGGYPGGGSTTTYTQIFDGSTTLQTNNGSGDFHKAGGLEYSTYINGPTQYYYDYSDSTPDVSRVNNVDAWVADHCLGIVNPNFYDDEFEIVNS